MIKSITTITTYFFSWKAENWLMALNDEIIVLSPLPVIAFTGILPLSYSLDCFNFFTVTSFLYYIRVAFFAIDFDDII